MLAGVGADQRVKVIDMGLAVRIPPAGHPIHDVRQVGKPQYMPPEIFLSRPYYPVEVDVWCIGVCLYLLLFGRYPYAKQVDDPYFDVIASGRLLQQLLAWHWVGPGGVSTLAADLLCRMLVVEPQRRIRVSEALAHQWFRAAL